MNTYQFQNCNLKLRCLFTNTSLITLSQGPKVYLKLLHSLLKQVYENKNLGTSFLGNEDK